MIGLMAIDYGPNSVQVERFIERVKALSPAERSAIRTQPQSPAQLAVDWQDVQLLLSVIGIARAVRDYPALGDDAFQQFAGSGPRIVAAMSAGEELSGEDLPSAEYGAMALSLRDIIDADVLDYFYQRLEAYIPISSL